MKSLPPTKKPPRPLPPTTSSPPPKTTYGKSNSKTKRSNNQTSRKQWKKSNHLRRLKSKKRSMSSWGRRLLHRSPWFRIRIRRLRRLIGNSSSNSFKKWSRKNSKMKRKTKKKNPVFLMKILKKLKSQRKKSRIWKPCGRKRKNLKKLNRNARALSRILINFKMASKTKSSNLKSQQTKPK